MAVAVHPQLVGVGESEKQGRCSALISAVDRTVAEFVSAELATLEAVDPALGRFGRVASDCVLAGGKRLRPTFAYWGWRGVAGPVAPLAPIVPALASLEMLHAFALVQDDVMDRSATRRGRPTAHRVFAEQHASAARTGDSDRFGAAAAMLAGDLLLVWADQLLSTATLPARTLIDARRRYDQMRVEAIAGQYLDVVGETDAASWSVQRALLVACLKTASYTVQRPLQFGAALVGEPVDPSVTVAYDAYGRAVGQAFQLRDDVLGIYGDPALTGKPAGDDLRTGKPTTLLMTAGRLATPGQRAALDQALAEAAHAKNLDARPIVGLITATGAVDEVESMIRQQVAEAVDALDAAPIHSAARDSLAELAVAVTHRQA